MKNNSIDTMKKLWEEMEIAGALSRDYPDVVMLDFVEDTAVTIKREGNIIPEEQRTLRRSYNDTWEYYINRYVIPEDQDTLRAGISLERVKRALGKSDEYACSYRVKADDSGIHHYQASFIRFFSRYKTEGQVILGFRCVDAIVEREQQNSRIQEEQLRIIGALSQEYSSLFKIDTETRVASLYRTDGSAFDPEVLKKMLALMDYEMILNEYIDRFVEEEDRESIREAIKLPNLLEKVPQEGLYKLNFRRIIDGREAYYEMNFVKIVDSRGKNSIILGLRNVDDLVRRKRRQEVALKKAYDAAKAANRAKSNFLFNMSHDIRTPMNAIIGFTNLLKKNLDNKELSLDYIEKIETANEFLLSLINNVLEMARIESGKVSLEETPLKAGAFFKPLEELFRPQMEEKNIKFVTSIDVEHHYAFVDGTKLREIYLNILSNAVKYTPAGGSVTLKLTEFPSDRPGYAVYRAEVEDTGIGISEEFLPHIFEEFTRERTSTESRIGGTGLGMPIVKRLVELMEGTIEVESRQGEGTRFTVSIPLRIAEPEDIRKYESGPASLSDENLTGKRILLAEDNDLNAEIAAAILEEQNFLVERAEDGTVCVDMIENSQPGYYDLVLMDIQMPNMDGYMATQLIRRMPDVSKSEIPIVAMTANAFEEDRKKAVAMGMDGHISKPIQIDVIKNTLNSILTKK